MLKYIALQIKTTNSDTMNPLFSQIAFDEKKKKRNYNCSIDQKGENPDLIGMQF